MENTFKSLNSKMDKVFHKQKNNQNYINYCLEKQNFFRDLITALQNKFTPHQFTFFIEYVLPKTLKTNPYKADTKCNTESKQKHFQEGPLSVNPTIFLYDQPEKNNYKRFKTQQISNKCDKKMNTPKMRMSRIVFDDKRILDLHRKLQGEYSKSIEKRIVKVDPIYFHNKQKIGRKAQYVAKFRKRQITRENNNKQDGFFIPTSLIRNINQTKSLNYYLSHRTCKTQASQRRLL